MEKNIANLLASRPMALDFVTPRAASDTHPSVVPVCRLTVDALCLARGDRVLIPSLGFDLSAGTVLQITGPNGCGKTTLLRALAGLSRPESGAIVWSGASEPLSEPPRIAYLGHRNALKADLSPREELAYAQKLREAPETGRVAECLERFGLQDCADVPCGQLSAGQQRRVALARVLLADCQVWILDEPLTALDARACSEFQHLLSQHLHGHGLALLSTHHPLALDGDRLQTLALEAPC